METITEIGDCQNVDVQLPWLPLKLRFRENHGKGLEKNESKV